MLGIGAVTPLLLKAGVDIAERKYVPLGIMNCMQGQEYTVPPGTIIGYWNVYYTDMNIPFVFPDNWPIQYVDDGKDSPCQILKALKMKGHERIMINGESQYSEIHLAPGTIKYVYNPTTYADPRYKDYLIPNWKPSDQHGKLTTIMNKSR